MKLCISEPGFFQLDMLILAFLFSVLFLSGTLGISPGTAEKNQSVFTEFTRALLYIIATIAHLCTKNCLSYIQTNFSCFQALELGPPTIYFSHQRMPWPALQA